MICAALAGQCKRAAAFLCGLFVWAFCMGFLCGLFCMGFFCMGFFCAGRFGIRP